MVEVTNPNPSTNLVVNPLQQPQPLHEKSIEPSQPITSSSVEPMVYPQQLQPAASSFLEAKPMVPQETVFVTSSEPIPAQSTMAPNPIIVTTSAATSANTTVAPQEKQPLDATIVLLLDLLIPGLGHLAANIPNEELRFLYPKYKTYPNGWVYLGCFLASIAVYVVFVFLLFIPIVGWIIDVLLLVGLIAAQIALRVFACMRSYDMQQKVITKWNQQHGVMPSNV